MRQKRGRWYGISVILPALVLAAFLPGCSNAPSDLYVVTSVAQNVRTESLDLAGDGWSVQKRTLHGGKQEGVDVITVDNGVMQVVIIPTRGMSIYEVRSSDLRLGWDSPLEEIVHPSMVDLESRGGLGWLEGFNEWLVRCGLEFAGHPGTDEFVNNTGDTGTMDLTLHGKVGNIPASEVSIFIDKAPPYSILVTGEIYEKFFYGPKFKMVSTIKIIPGQSTFEIEDKVTNLGEFDQEFQLIYHANFGQPLLGEGSTVHAAAKQISPMNEHAGKAIDDYATYSGPTKGFVEQVYLIEPYANDLGVTEAVLRNAAGDRAVSMQWSLEQLPYLIVWKNTAATESGYVTGIQPATGYPYNRKVERAAGRVPKLAPGQTREFTLTFGLYHDEAQVDAAVQSVQSIQAGRQLDVQRDPPN